MDLVEQHSIEKANSKWNLVLTRLASVVQIGQNLPLIAQTALYVTNPSIGLLQADNSLNTLQAIYRLKNNLLRSKFLIRR